MKILITGVNGFVGSNLVLNLGKVHNIYGLDIKKKKSEGLIQTFNWCEINKIPSVDVIIHLAGKAHDTKNTSLEKDYFDVNVGLTKIICEYFLNSQASKFIFFSSVKAVADSIGATSLKETFEPNPKTAYGESKLEAERIILTECGKLEDDNLTILWDDSTSVKNGNKKFYILRPCMIHGPGNKGNLNLIYNISKKRLPWPLGAFDNQRSFCSIYNIAFIVQHLIERNIESGVYNVADDEALSTNELIRLIAKSQNKKTLIWKIPPGPIRSLARLGDFLPFPLNSERLKKLTQSYLVSNEKIKRALKIEKMPFTAEEGFRKTFESFRNQTVYEQ
jgi:nucleoside-diphosphate-sugar epimerase